MPVLERKTQDKEKMKHLPTLYKRQEEKLARFINKTSEAHKGIESHKYIFVPYHQGKNHWVLFFVGVDEQIIWYWDSLSIEQTSAPPSDAVQLLQNALTHWFPNIQFQTHVDSVPQQANGYDCGVFMLYTMQQVCRKLRQGQTGKQPFRGLLDNREWSQADITQYRKELPVLIVKRLLKGPPRPSRAIAADEHEEIQAISPRTYKTYWKLIKRGGVRYQKVSQPYICTIHESQPFVEEEYKALMQIDYRSDPPKEAQRIARVNALVLQRQIIERHLKQFKSQRAYIQARVRALPKRTREQWEVVVYEDFVASYNKNGQKIQNLVFTVEWRDENGELVRRYIDNVCSNLKDMTADSYYVRNVWHTHLRVNALDHQLTNPDLTPDAKHELEQELQKLLASLGGNSEFRGVTRILRTGDNGAHFHSRVTIEFESTAFENYGILWETHTLCKRHGYNLCDAHGGAIKRLVKAAAVRGVMSQTAEDYCNVINASTDGVFAETKAFCFLTIDRSYKERLLKSFRNALGMKACCEFQYDSQCSDGTFKPTSHFVRMRMCSNDPTEQYTSVLLVQQREPGTRYCSKCTVLKQAPIHHQTGIRCPHANHVAIKRQFLPNVVDYVFQQAPAGFPAVQKARKSRHKSTNSKSKQPKQTTPNIRKQSNVTVIADAKHDGSAFNSGRFAEIRNDFC